MQNELLAAGGGSTQLSVEVHLLPALHQLRLFLRQSGAHRKICFRQVKGLGVIHLFSGIGHSSDNCLGVSGVLRLNWRSHTGIFRRRKASLERDAKNPDLPAAYSARKAGPIIRIEWLSRNWVMVAGS